MSWDWRNRRCRRIWRACATVGWWISGPQGRASVYRLARPELLDMFRAAEGGVGGDRQRRRLGPNYGHPTERKVAR